MVAKKSRAPEPSPAAAPGEEPSFEQALERLETIVSELEGGALTLEQSIARYEEGVRLSRRLTQTLDQAEKRIERLTEGDGDAPATAPMELGEGEDEAAAEASRPARSTGRPAGAARERPTTPPAPDELPF